MKTDQTRIILAVCGAIVALACALACSPARAAGVVDGERAMQLIKEQCDFGPRIPFTKAHDDCQKWIEDQFKKLGWTVKEETFEVRLPMLDNRLFKATNIWALPAADGPTTKALIMSAHWDTRPWADQDPKGGKMQFLAADDGGSGVAMLIEIARALQGDPLRDHVAIALWDVEDDAFADGPIDDWGLGAAYSAAHPPAWIKRVSMGINFDMVGGFDFSATREIDSLKAAPNAVNSLWNIGHDLHSNLFSSAMPSQVIDDHTPWNDKGLIPFIDLIGFPFQYWHTTGDTPEHCSAPVLAGVGEVAMEWLREKAWENPKATTGRSSRRGR